MRIKSRIIRALGGLCGGWRLISGWSRAGQDSTAAPLPGVVARRVWFRWKSGARHPRTGDSAPGPESDKTVKNRPSPTAGRAGARKGE